MARFELVIKWETGETDVHEFKTEEEALTVGKNMKMVFGEQIEWCGVRVKRRA